MAIKRKKRLFADANEDERAEELLADYFIKRKRKKRKDKKKNKDSDTCSKLSDEKKEEGRTEKKEIYEPRQTVYGEHNKEEKEVRLEEGSAEKKEDPDNGNDACFCDKSGISYGMEEAEGSLSLANADTVEVNVLENNEEVVKEKGSYTAFDKKRRHKKTFFNETGNGGGTSKYSLRREKRYQKSGRTFFRDVKKAADIPVKAASDAKHDIGLIDQSIEDEYAASMVPSASVRLATNYISYGVRAAASFVLAVLSAIFGPMIAVIWSVLPLIYIVVIIVVVIAVSAFLFITSILFAFVSVFESYDTDYQNTSSMYKAVYEYATEFTKEVCKDIDDGISIKYYIGNRSVAAPGDIEIDYEGVYLIYLSKFETAIYETESLELSDGESILDTLLEGNKEYEKALKEIFDNVYSYMEMPDGHKELHVCEISDYYLTYGANLKYQKDNYQVFESAVYSMDVDISANARKLFEMMSGSHIWALDEYVSREEKE